MTETACFGAFFAQIRGLLLMLLRRCLFLQVDELKALRIETTAIEKTVTLKCGETTALGDLGHAVEIRAAFSSSVRQALTAGSSVSFGVEMSFWPLCIMKSEYLPRQARGKHRKR